MAYLLTTLSLVLSILLLAQIIPCIQIVTCWKKLFDIPNERKVYDGIISCLGGISFVPTILFSLSFVTGLRYLIGFRIAENSLHFIIPEFFFSICGLMLLYLSGIKEGLVGLCYRTKFIVQVIVASMFPHPYSCLFF